MRLQARALNLTATLVPARAGVTAILSLRKPNSQVVTKSLVTDPNGSAVAQFALGRSDKPGVYVCSVSLSVNSLTVSDQTSITVQ